MHPRVVVRRASCAPVVYRGGMQPTQPGWYWDPKGMPNLFRWWDGEQWTGEDRPDFPLHLAPDFRPADDAGGIEALAGDEFIFDVQTHHVAAGRIIEMPPLLRYREFGAMMGNEALRGRTHDRGGTFWTWRERMYSVAARLDPDRYLALARAAVVSGTATAVSNRVSRRQAERWAEQGESSPAYLGGGAAEPAPMMARGFAVRKHDTSYADRRDARRRDARRRPPTARGCRLRR